jgi:hypothetical protein
MVSQLAMVEICSAPPVSTNPFTVDEAAVALIAVVCTPPAKVEVAFAL